MNEELLKRAAASLVRINDESFVEQIAKELHCLPSYFVNSNEHIIKAAQKLNKEVERLKIKCGEVDGRSHEECDDCALEDVQPQECLGHVPGPSHCKRFIKKS